jgi:F0F1-type ATP synthase epsilon subunit
LFVARTTNGTLTILPHHQDITADLVIQKVKINSNSHKRELELGHSFFVFKDEELKILTEMCT